MFIWKVNIEGMMIVTADVWVSADSEQEAKKKAEEFVDNNPVKFMQDVHEFDSETHEIEINGLYAEPTTREKMMREMEENYDLEEENDFTNE